MYKEEGDVLTEVTRETHECDVEEFDTLYSSKKTIAILGNRWRPQAAKQEGGDIVKNVSMYCLTKQRNKRPTVGGVSIRSRSGGPSRKGCEVNVLKTKASNK